MPKYLWNSNLFSSHEKQSVVTISINSDHSGSLQYHEIELKLSTCWVNFQHFIWVPDSWVYFFSSELYEAWRNHVLDVDRGTTVLSAHPQLINCFFFSIIFVKFIYLFIIITFFLCGWLCVESCFIALDFKPEFFP